MARPTTIVIAIAAGMTSFLWQRWRSASRATHPQTLDQTPPGHQSTEGTLKRVYLIRHAESLENERSASLQRSASDLLRLRLPSRTDVLRASELLDIQSQVDSDVSDVGWDQIRNVSQQMRADGFLTRRDVRLVAHSPLKRARQTSEGMLGCVAAAREGAEWASVWGGYNHSDSLCSSATSEWSDSDALGRSKLTAPVDRVDELPCLLEKAAAEWLPGNSGAFEARIASFEGWLSNQPERVVAIVGHSQFFRAMLGLDYLFGNCDVWEVMWDSRWQETSPSLGSDTHIGVIEETETKESVNTEGMVMQNLPRGWSNLQKLYSYEQKETRKGKGTL